MSQTKQSLLEEWVYVVLEAIKDDSLFAEIARSGGRPLNSKKIRDCMALVDELLVARNGLPQSTLDQACFHAAGLALNVHNFRADVESIRIHPIEWGFTGAVHYAPLEKLSSPTLTIFRESVTTISGFAAEKYMGLGHPSSSVFGKVMTGIYCHYLGKTLQKDPEYFFLRALAHAETAIARNRHAFNVLVYTLTRTRRLSPADTNAAFKGFHRIPLTLRDQEAA